MGLEMTEIKSNFRLGIQIKDFDYFLRVFVGSMGKAVLGAGIRPSFCRVLIGARKAIVLML